MKRQSSWQRFRRWLLLPIPALFLLAGAPAFAGSDVGVSVSFNLGPPPVPVSYSSDLVLIPGTEVYFLPVSGVDIFFYGGHWWSHRGPRWYRSYSYDGPWTVIEHRFVPGPLYRVPHDYRTVYRHGKRYPYRHWDRIGDRHRSGGKLGWLERHDDRWDRRDHRWEDRRHGRDWRDDRRDGRDHRWDGRRGW